MMTWGGQPSETKKRRTEVRIIRDQFNEMIKKASDAKVCFICGGVHGIEDCAQYDDDRTKIALDHMRTILEEQSKSPSSSEKSRAGTATRGRKDKLPKKGIMPQGKRWNRTRFVEKEEVTKSFYSQSAYMYEIADREDGGPWLVNGAEIHPQGQGVNNKDELDRLIERAAEESPPVYLRFESSMTSSPRPRPSSMHGVNNRNKIMVTTGINTHGINIGTLKMARINGEEYAGVWWYKLRSMLRMHGWEEDMKSLNG